MEKTMRKKNRFTVLFVLFAAVLLSAQVQAKKRKVYHACGVDIVKKGNSITGRVYRASKHYHRARKNKVFENILGALSSSKLKVTTANKRKGYITAIDVEGFLAAKLSYNVMVQRMGRRGVKIHTFYVVDPLTPAKDFKSVFCKIYSAAL